MDKDAVNDALVAHLNVLQDITAWAVVVAITVGWAGYKRLDKIDIGPIHIERDKAQYVLMGVYLLTALHSVLLLFRVHNLLELGFKHDFVASMSALATHPWVGNPFGLLVGNVVARFSCAIGVAVIIASWWICASSLVLIRTHNEGWLLMLQLLFYALGIVFLVLLLHIFVTNISRLQVLAPKNAQAAALGRVLLETRLERWGCITLAHGLGIWLYVRTVRIRHQQAAVA
jgi:hypothetical protein